MAQRKTLTTAQVDLLRWVDEGCPDGVYEGVHHRISAAALHRRGLVTASGHGDRWSAEITDAGQAYLAEVDGPRPPIARQATLSVSDQLIADVVAAGGTLRVPKRGWGGRGVDWERRVAVAIEHRKVPIGKELTFHRQRDDEDEVRLVDLPDDMVPRGLSTRASPATSGPLATAAAPPKPTNNRRGAAGIIRRPFLVTSPASRSGFCRHCCVGCVDNPPWVVDRTLVVHEGSSPPPDGLPELVKEVKEVRTELKKWTDGNSGIKVSAEDRHREARRMRRYTRARRRSHSAPRAGWLGRWDALRKRCDSTWESWRFRR